jgi:predicted nucleotidyltransferase
MEIQNEIDRSEREQKNKVSLIHYPIASEQLSIYRQKAEQNWQKSHLDREKRRVKAWQLVEKAKVLLKEKFGVTKIMVFGSLIHEDCFTLWSDIDIAAWGISPLDTFKAIGEVRELDDTIEINLFDSETCQPELVEKILQEGKIV